MVEEEADSDIIIVRDGEDFKNDQRGGRFGGRNNGRGGRLFNNIF